MKLTVAEQKTLRLMCHLACSWESTLADSVDHSDIYGPLNKEAKSQMAACRRNIKRFEALYKKLLAPSPEPKERTLPRPTHARS